jgi:ribonuclease HII
VSIATASIIAKVTRDRIMWELHELYPQYGFASHKGYGTKAHREALLKHGPCPVHRVSFKGVVGAGTVPLFDADPTSCK